MKDTWLRGEQRWTQILDVGPTARWGHAMVFDENRKSLVAFGGFGDRLGAMPLNDTWESSALDSLKPEPA